MSARFADAVHVLALLAERPGVPVPSAELAASLGAHPTQVRRLLGALAAAGITTTQFGAGGGALLARAAERVTLRDVHRAVDGAEPFAAAWTAARAGADPGTLVGRHVAAALAPHVDAAARAAERELARATIADVLREVGRQELRRARVARRAGPGASREGGPGRLPGAR